jgi:hypothetical protein
VRVLFLLESEIDEAARAFAQKFADLRRRRRVLLGADPFASLAIPREALVFRLKQVLLNQQLRLRAAYVARGLPEDQLVGVLASAAGPLRTAAASLLELEGQGALAPREALARVAGALPEARRWEEALARMSDARQGRPLAAGVPSRTLLDLIELTGRLKERVPS